MCLVEPSISRSDQYMLGADLLVAPVLEAGAVERTLELPPGEWIDLWRSATYDEGTGGIVVHDAPRVVLGPATFTVPAPLDEIPVFVRRGAVIAMLPPHVWSLAGDLSTVRTIDLQLPSS